MVTKVEGGVGINWEFGMVLEKIDNFGSREDS